MRMYRRILALSLVVFAALPLALAGPGPARIAAQESTPDAAGEAITVIELAPGVTAEIFTGAPSDRAPDQTVYLARFVFQPGSEIFPHSHPGTTVLGVASGSFGWTLVEGTAHVVRGAAA